MITTPTQREDEIRGLVARGLKNDEIAEELGISRRTVEAHLRMLYRTAGVSRRQELATAAGAAVSDRSAAGGAARVRELEVALREREREIRTYEAAVRKIVDRQFPLFEERVEITVKVGHRPEEDRVTERRWTTPKPYLVYRVIRPIMPQKGPKLSFGDLRMGCDVISKDVGLAVEPLNETGHGVQALILFQPGLSEETEWLLRYRVPGLWDPLRETGSDTLAWSWRTLDGREATGLTISRLRLHIDVPADMPRPEVIETNGQGVTQAPVDTGTGYVRVTFDDESAGVRRYDWRITLRS